MATINAQDSKLRKMIGRFRVLIIGRANAGKTTILQKVCNTTDNPEIYNTKGKKIDDTVVESSIKRGNHDIENEMVFKSSPGFVFHDSCGFEAGSEGEFENMKNFISEHVNAKKLEERIHAIWYCIPMDDPSRTFQRSEEKFFIECDTGHVPVVVVFTKFDALRPVAFGEIKKELKGLSAEERSRRIAQRVEELFTNTGVLDRLSDPKNRACPKSHVRLDNMNKPNANCKTLLESTTFALDDKELRLCLVSTQQSNLELCIKCAVSTLVNRSLGPLRIDSEDYQYDIARWFPHLKVRRRLIQSDDTLVMVLTDDLGRILWRIWRMVVGIGEITWRDDIIRILQPLVAKGSLFTAGNRLIQTGIATIIVLEYSAFLPNNLKDLERIDSAVHYYLKSLASVAVEIGAKEISRQGYKKEELEKTILKFIFENRMSYSKGLNSKEVDDA
ncbi:hypothetical protein P692DRAFT_201798169 [Suillus brevipes Sb2]|nr:hypothetical protein P692DRAFT_201798169 [Suillus brevipes Sb2]